VKESLDKKPPVAVQGDENAATFRELLSLQEKHTELSSMLVKQNQLNHLPVKESPVFSGDPFDYPAFTTTFMIVPVILHHKNNPDVKINKR